MPDHLTYDDLERYAAAARLRAEADADQAKADAMAPDDNQPRRRIGQCLKHPT